MTNANNGSNAKSYDRDKFLMEDEENKEIKNSLNYSSMEFQNAFMFHLQNWQ